MVLLYTAFRSLKDALLVILNVLTATMGGVWALKLTGMPFSISAAVGLRLDLRGRRPERRSANLVLQPDAGARACRSTRP